MSFDQIAGDTTGATPGPDCRMQLDHPAQDRHQPHKTLHHSALLEQL
jgi:hypothetical protein